MEPVLAAMSPIDASGYIIGGREDYVHNLESLAMQGRCGPFVLASKELIPVMFSVFPLVNYV